jgi:hypothetical protein
MWKATSTLAVDRLTAPARPVAIARILVGAAALLQIPGLRGPLATLLTPGTFRAPYSVSLPFHALWISPAVGLMMLLALSATIGWWTRTALVGLAAAVAYVMCLDQQLYRNDLYLLFLELCLLALAGSGAALSVDARRTGGRDFVTGWPVLLLKIQLSIVYTTTAISKINPSFLSGDVLQGSLRLPELPDWAAISLAVVTIALEGFLALGLWFRATRRIAMLAGFVLHTSFVVLLAWGPQLVAFGLEMAALYVLFLDMPPVATFFHRKQARASADSLEIQ